jgi:hypothetical protein
MAGGYGSEYAVILPQGNTDTLQWALQVREKQHQEKLLREKQLRDQQEHLSGYLDKELDYTKFATGTPADPVNIDAIRELRTKYAQGIMQGKYNSTASLTYDMQNDLSKLVNYSNNAKMTQASINKSLEEYKKEDGFDLDALRKGAIRSAFMTIDPTTGQPIVRDQVDPSQDYVRRYLKEHPEKVITGPQALVKQFSDLKTTGYTDVIQTDVKGKKRRIEVAAELLPYQELDIKNGEPVGRKFKTEELTLQDGTKVKGLPKAAVDEWFTTPSSEAILNMEMKRQYPNVLEGNSDYPALRSKIALDISNQYARGGKFSRKDLSDQDVWAGKMQAGININVNDKKEKKENVFEVLKNIKKGDLSYLPDATPDANGLIDITSALPNGIMYSGRTKKTTDGTMSKEAFNAVLYNPKTKTFWVQDESKGDESELREIPRGKEKAEFQKLAEANGIPVKDFLKIWEGVSPGTPESGGGTSLPGMATIRKYLPFLKKKLNEPKSEKSATKGSAPNKKKKYNPATGKFE